MSPLKKLLSNEPKSYTNRAKDYYENDKESLREQARVKYRNLSEEEKNKKRKYGRNRYYNISDEKKQKLKKYQQNYRETKIKQKHFIFFIDLLIYIQCFLSHTLLNP